MTRLSMSNSLVTVEARGDVRAVFWSPFGPPIHRHDAGEAAEGVRRATITNPHYAQGTRRGPTKTRRQT